MLERISNFFRRRDDPWVSPDEAHMSAAERAFVEERAEDRDFDQVIRAQLGGFDPDGLLGFPESERHD